MLADHGGADFFHRMLAIEAKRNAHNKKRSTFHPFWPG
jgi:hypothetical protein